MFFFAFMAHRVTQRPPQITSGRRPRATGPALCGFFLALGALSGCGDEPPKNCDPRCDQNTLVSCDESGEVIQTPCGLDRCAIDSPVPQCVPADALPCDPAQAGVLSCINGRPLECDPDALYQWLGECPTGELCAPEQLSCLPVEEIHCLKSTWVPLCINDTTYLCEAGRNRVIAQPQRCPTR